MKLIDNAAKNKFHVQPRQRKTEGYGSSMGFASGWLNPMKNRDWQLDVLLMNNNTFKT